MEEILHNEYKPEITVEDGLRLSLKALKKVLGDNFSIDRIEAAYIATADKKFRRIPKQRIGKLSSELKDDKKVKK